MPVRGIASRFRAATSALVACRSRQQSDGHPLRETKRYAGKKKRVVPICNILRPFLQTQANSRITGDDRVCQIGKLNGRHKAVIDGAIIAAGLSLWPDRYQSLRASYDTDLRGLVPDYAADSITGHSQAVARKHYNRNTPDEVMERGMLLGSTKAAQKAAHRLQESTGNDETAREASIEKTAENEQFAAHVVLYETIRAMGDEGLEPPTSRV
jgi:hypothetical protein